MAKNDKKNKYLCGKKNGETMVPEKYVRFDWAVKRLLRDKANFGVLEGLVSVILNEKIHIVELLESESNMDHDSDKFNRVDIKALDSRNEIIVVEIQQSCESDFVGRILYGVSKNIVEHINLGDDYGKVKKVYSINIVYFNFGEGSDYLYHGQTVFTGVNTHDTLRISVDQKDALTLQTPGEIFPEYYIVRVNQYDKADSTTPLEEWLDYLKNGRIKDDATAPGLNLAKEILLYIMMSEEEKRQYFRYMDHVKFERDAMKTSRREGMRKGLAKGMKKGLVKGEAKGKTKVVINMLKMNLDIDFIAQTTGLSAQEIVTIRKQLDRK
ncbi:MAG: Rpn family recombination-promoting nuclease/putative transposase [Bacteroidales bacterium]|nr:Rpn family recombination-promoting nuclease/putative transposase [Bacteroidales bacterium]